MTVLYYVRNTVSLQNLEKRTLALTVPGYLDGAFAGK